MVFGLAGNIGFIWYLNDRKQRGRQVQMASFQQLKSKQYIDR